MCPIVTQDSKDAETRKDGEGEPARILPADKRGSARGRRPLFALEPGAAIEPSSSNDVVGREEDGEGEQARILPADERGSSRSRRPRKSKSARKLGKLDSVLQCWSLEDIMNEHLFEVGAYFGSSLGISAVDLLVMRD